MSKYVNTSQAINPESLATFSNALCYEIKAVIQSYVNYKHLFSKSYINHNNF